MPKSPEQKSPIVLAIAEAEYVMLLLDLNLMGKHLCVTDLFRVVNGKVVEHWDAIQDLSALEISLPMFEIDMNVVLNDDDNALVMQHLDHKQTKVHRTVTEGNVVGVQSEVYKSGKRFVSYDFSDLSI